MHQHFKTVPDPYVIVSQWMYNQLMHELIFSENGKLPFPVEWHIYASLSTKN